MYKSEKNKLLSFVNDEIQELFKEEGCFIAGGAITSVFCNRDINDIDVYFRSVESLLRCIAVIYSREEKILTENQIAIISDMKAFSLLCVNVTDKSISFKTDSEDIIQFSHFRFFESPLEIFKTFDFTACMGAYDCRGDSFVFQKDFLKHNSQRYLKFNTGTAFPIVSLLRVQKYQEKGYKISKQELLRVVMASMNLKVIGWETLRSHIGGMYGLEMSEVFDEDKPFSLGEVSKQLSNLSLIPNTTDHAQNVDYKTLIKRIKEQHIPGYKERYFKWVTSGLNSASTLASPLIHYAVGSIVSGGKDGIYICYDNTLHNQFGHSLAPICIELEPLKKQCHSFKETLLGPVKVLRQLSSEEVKQIREEGE